MAKKETESSKDAPASEPLAASQSSASGGNPPAGLNALDRRFHIYGDDGKTVIAATDNPLSAYSHVAHGRKVMDSKSGQPWRGGPAAGGFAQLNVVTIVALMAMFFLSFGMLSTLARAQTPTTPKTAITDLTIKIKEGETLKIPAGNYTLKDSLRLPARATLDLTGSMIRFEGRDWQVAINSKGTRDATLIGGTWNLGKLNYVADADSSQNFTMRGVRLLDGGGLIQVRGVADMLIEDCSADIVERNFIYLGDSANDRVTLRRVRLIEGSRAESGVRVHKTTNLLIDDCDINAKINKKTALRLHDGSTFLVKNSHFTGGVGVGPLTDADGGRRLGIDQWIGVGGNHDLGATATARRDKLAIRALNVRFVDCTVNGSLVAKAGGEFEYFGGAVTPPGKQRIFEDTSERYPELPEWTLPGDELRPAPVGKLIDVTLPAGVALNLPKQVALGTTKGFEVWLAHYNFQTTGARQPLDLLWSYPRPIWFAEASGQYGFWPMSRFGDLGTEARDKIALRDGHTFAATVPAPVIVDLEKFWYGDLVSVDPASVEIASQRADAAGRFLDAVIAGRTNPNVPIGAYLPNSVIADGGEGFQKLAVETFTRPLIARLDYLVIDIYPHPKDRTPAQYEARARKVLAAYKSLNKPIRAIYWYSAPAARFDPDGFLRAAKNAAIAEGAIGLVIWDDPSTPWTAAMTYDFDSIRK